MSPASGHIREIVVPGSVANLGPAFDALAVAVGLYLRVRILDQLPGEPGRLEIEFTGAAPSGENRIATAFRRAEQAFGGPAPGLRVEVRSEIPMRAGLGSSAAATVAGLRLYEAVTTRRPSSDWLGLASEIEGHPDNAAAALLGGLALSCQAADGRVDARAWRWPDAVRLIVATPDVGLETAFARTVLPATIPLRDAVFNLQRSLLLMRALEDGRFQDLREALRDRWHQPARMAHVPGLEQALALDHPAVLGTCLSGAGPSIAAFATDRHEEAADALRGIYDGLGLACTIRTLAAHQPAA